MAAINNNWLNAQALRRYPLDDNATGIGDDGVTNIKDDIILDMHLRWPELAGQFAFLGGLTVTDNLVTAVILAADNQYEADNFTPLAAITLQQPVDRYRFYDLEPLYPGVGGFIAFGDLGENCNIRMSTPVQGLLAPRIAKPYAALPVPSIRKNGRVDGLTGVVEIRGGTDIEVVKESVLVDGEERDALVVRLTTSTDATTNTLQTYIGPCGERPESRNCNLDGIETINGVGPDCDGNILITFEDLTAGPFSCGSEVAGVTLDQSLGLDEACPAPLVEQFVGSDACNPEDPVEPGESSQSSVSQSSQSSASVPSSSLVGCRELPYEECFLQLAQLDSAWSLKSGSITFVDEVHLVESCQSSGTCYDYWATSQSISSISGTVPPTPSSSSVIVLSSSAAPSSSSAAPSSSSSVAASVSSSSSPQGPASCSGEALNETLSIDENVAVTWGNFTTLANDDGVTLTLDDGNDGDNNVFGLSAPALAFAPNGIRTVTYRSEARADNEAVGQLIRLNIGGVWTSQKTITYDSGTFTTKSVSWSGDWSVADFAAAQVEITPSIDDNFDEMEIDFGEVVLDGYASCVSESSSSAPSSSSSATPAQPSSSSSSSVLCSQGALSETVLLDENISVTWGNYTTLQTDDGSRVFIDDGSEDSESIFGLAAPTKDYEDNSITEVTVEIQAEPSNDDTTLDVRLYIGGVWTSVQQQEWLDGGGDVNKTYTFNGTWSKSDFTDFRIGVTPTGMHFSSEMDIDFINAKVNGLTKCPVPSSSVSPSSSSSVALPSVSSSSESCSQAVVEETLTLDSNVSVQWGDWTTLATDNGIRVTIDDDDDNNESVFGTTNPVNTYDTGDGITQVTVNIEGEAEEDEYGLNVRIYVGGVWSSPVVLSDWADSDSPSEYVKSYVFNGSWDASDFADFRIGVTANSGDFTAEMYIDYINAQISGVKTTCPDDPETGQSGQAPVIEMFFMDAGSQSLSHAQAFGLGTVTGDSSSFIFLVDNPGTSPLSVADIWFEEETDT